MELYPLKFKPIRKDKIWGYESWQLSPMPSAESEVENGYLAENTLNELVEVYMGELVGDKVYEKYGNTFPLLFKLIDTNEDLSVQVHPDDAVAEKKHQSFGKTEMWYVMRHGRDANVVLGLNRDTNREEVQQQIEQKNIASLLNLVQVQKGSVGYIPAGLVHALGRNVVVAEIQQASDITYRLYDYDRLQDGKPRELHIAQALDVMRFDKHLQSLLDYKPKMNGAVNLVKDEHFTTNLISFNNSVLRDYAPLDSFVVYMCVDGECCVFAFDHTEFIKEGECILIPASADDVLLRPVTRSAKVLETYIEL